MKQPIHIGSRKQVFIDNRFVDVANGVTLSPQAPRRADGDSIAQEHSWECFSLGYMSVAKADGVYHMWYCPVGIDAERGRPIRREEYYQKPSNQPGSRKGMIRGVCYARSTDGVHWEKPMLGMTTDLKDNDNNFCVGYGASGVSGSAKGAVCCDPHAPASERFLMIAGAGGDVAGLPGQDGGLIALCSADGIHWKPKAAEVVMDTERRHLDTHNVVFWDDRLGKYVAYLRKNPNPPGFGQFRTIARAESETLQGLPTVQDADVVFAPDQLDPSAYNPHFGHTVPVVDYYTPCVIKYPWAQDAYYMFPSAYFKYDDWFLHEYQNGAPVNAGPVDIRFAAGRDGVLWQRYDRRPFVRLGRTGSPDSGALYMGWGMVDAGDGDIYMYYEASDGVHGWNRNKENNDLICSGGHGPAADNSVHVIRRLAIRRDGFLSLHGSYGGGFFTTPLLRCAGDRLEINVDTSALGMIRVEIQDEHGRFLDGYSREDCDIIHSVNDVSHVVRWRGNADTAAVTDRPIRILFEIRDADLYAFQFQPRS